jgi:hypothetical protein
MHTSQEPDVGPSQPQLFSESMTRSSKVCQNGSRFQEEGENEPTAAHITLQAALAASSEDENDDK